MTDSNTDTFIKAEPEVTVEQEKYSVVTVDKIPAPDGLSGDDWYQYVIGVGNSRIVGCKTGTLSAVTEHARTVAEDMNFRASRFGSLYPPRLRR